MSTIFSPDKFAVKSFSMCSMERSENLSWDIADRSQFLILLIIEIFFFTLITNNLALTYSLKYDNANKMRQCENIFVFIDLTKSIGSDLGGQCPPRPPPNSAYVLKPALEYLYSFVIDLWVCHDL